MKTRRWIPLVLLAVMSTACGTREPDHSGDAAAAAAIPTGSYALEFQVGDVTVPGVLELVALDGEPWGRLTLDQGMRQTMAVRGVDRTSDGWRFVVGGPVHGLEVRFGAELSGGLMLGGSRVFLLTGRRTGDLQSEALLAHAGLVPMEDLSDADRGESFTTTDPEGTIYFARHGLDLSDPTLMLAARGGGRRAVRRLFPTSAHRDRSPYASPDGSRLLFASDRPVPGGDGTGEGFRLWSVERREGAWSDPVPVVVRDWRGQARQPAVTADGSLYFSSSDGPAGAGEGDLYLAPRLDDGSHGPPQNLGAPINSAGDEHGVYVSPDGEWMILVSSGGRRGALGGDDLYIAHREGSGWGEPRNLGLPVNTFANEYGPWVSRGGRFLYFTSDRFGTADIFRIELNRVRPLRALTFR